MKPWIGGLALTAASAFLTPLASAGDERAQPQFHFEDDYRAPIGPPAPRAKEDDRPIERNSDALEAERSGRLSDKSTRHKILSLAAGATAAALAEKCVRREIMGNRWPRTFQPKYVLESTRTTESHDRYLASKYNASEIVNKDPAARMRTRPGARRSTFKRDRSPAVEVDSLIVQN